VRLASNGLLVPSVPAGLTSDPAEFTRRSRFVRSRPLVRPHHTYTIGGGVSSITLVRSSGNHWDATAPLTTPETTSGPSGG
jgi:hypothetical protein